MRTINKIGDDCEARIRPVNHQYDYRQNVLLPYVSHICKVTPRPFRKYPKPVLTSDPEEPAFPTSPGVPVGPLHSEREDGLNKKKESIFHYLKFQGFAILLVESTVFKLVMTQ